MGAVWRPLAPQSRTSAHVEPAGGHQRSGEVRLQL